MCCILVSRRARARPKISKPAGHESQLRVNETAKDAVGYVEGGARQLMRTDVSRLGDGV